MGGGRAEFGWEDEKIILTNCSNEEENKRGSFSSKVGQGGPIKTGGIYEILEYIKNSYFIVFIFGKFISNFDF